MRALLFADQAGRGLAPLTDRTCLALLPAAGKPLVDHALDLLEAAGIRDVTLVLSPHAEEVERHLRSGERRGTAVEVVLSRGDEPPREIAARLGARFAPPYLAARADVLRTAGIAAFLEGAARVPGETPVAAAFGGEGAGMLLIRGEGWPEGGDPWTGAARVDVPGERALAVDSIRAFHRANLEAARGDFPGLVLPAGETAPGIRVGRRARLPLEAVREPPAFAGPRCEVHREAELRGDVVLSSDVVVDRGAALRSSVVLPHTYVGELVEIENAVVWSDLLIRVDTGAVARVTDAFLLSGLSKRGAASLAGRGAERLAGALLLLLSLPLWPAALLLSAGASAPLRRLRLRGNRPGVGPSGEATRRDFTSFEFRTRVPVLRRLPELLAVATGDLALVGVPPMSAADEALLVEEWERLRLDAPVGLFGPARLSLPRGAPPEEERLADAFYARTRSRKGDAGWLLRAAAALFTARAWAPGPAEGA